jgi:hypothetical protein
VSFTTLDTPHYNISHFLLDQPPFLGTQPMDKLPHFPHGLISVVLLRMFLNTVIGEVNKAVVNVI